MTDCPSREQLALTIPGQAPRLTIICLIMTAQSIVTAVVQYSVAQAQREACAFLSGEFSILFSFRHFSSRGSLSGLAGVGIMGDPRDRATNNVQSCSFQRGTSAS